MTGGEFLIRPTDANDVFIPEEFSEEQRMMRSTCEEFVEQHIVSKLDALDKQEEGLMESILNEAGSLGLLGVSVPESLQGMGSDFKTSMLVTEIGRAHV